MAEIKQVGLFDRLKEATRGWLREQLGYNLAADRQIDNDDYKYRRLGSKDSVKDLSPMAQERMLKIANYLYDSNCICNRLINMTADYIVAEGVKVESKNPLVDKIIKDFWYDPVNNLDLRLKQKVIDLSINGEQCYPVEINKANGFVRLNYIDPLNIDLVTVSDLNPEIALKVKLKSRTLVEQDNQGLQRDITELDVIRIDKDPMSDSYGKLKGDCFYFKINSVSNATRGRSDLLTIIDYADAYDKFLFNSMERAELMQAFIWDVTYTGLSEDQIRKAIQSETSPRPGSILRHNDKVEWKAVTPDLRSADFSETARQIRTHILGAKGIPEHFYGSGSETNLSTAQAQLSPTLKVFASRQKYVKYMLENIIDFVLDQAKLARVLTIPDSEIEYSIIFPEMEVKNIAEISGSLSNIANALMIAEDRGWITSETASKVFATVSGQIGVDIDTQKEYEQAQEETEIKELEPYTDEMVDKIKQQVTEALRSASSKRKTANTSTERKRQAKKNKQDTKGS